MGGRCFLEILVFCHSACHNVFVETICKQPKASITQVVKFRQVQFKNENWTLVFFLLLVLYDQPLYLNIHRYAFTPLIDDSDDEEIEEFIASENLGIVHERLTFTQNT